MWAPGRLQNNGKGSHCSFCEPEERGGKTGGGYYGKVLKAWGEAGGKGQGNATVGQDVAMEA